MSAKTKLTISGAALMARINRKLAHQGERLYKSRSDRAARDVGEFYIVDISRNKIIDVHVKPVAFAREIGVLEKYEDVE